MKKNYPNDDFLLPSISTITKIKGSYKEFKHSGDSWKNYRNDESCPRKSSTRRDKSRRNEFSRDEALVNSLDSSNARQEIRKPGPTTACKMKQKSANAASPASCLKTICSKKKDGVKKRVLFTETSCSPTSEDCYDHSGRLATTAHPCQEFTSDYDQDWYPSSSQCGRYRPRSRGLSSSSATVYEGTTTTSACSAFSSVCESSVTSNELDAKLARLKRETRSRGYVEPDTEPFRRTIVHQGDGSWRSEVRPSVRPAECSHAIESRDLTELHLPKETKLELERRVAPKSKSHSTSGSKCPSRRLDSSASARCTHGSLQQPSDALDSEEARLLDDLDRMALSSSTCCSGPTLPRIVKSRDVLKRVAIRRMLAYPPQGQSGEPLTLLKKWSNIDCHVQGDSQKGFRYKVYYLQEFESSTWYPDVQTGSPFHIDDEGCSTTDYG